PLALGATTPASQLSIGTHTITAMAIDDDGLHGQASISIRVRGPNQPPAIAITSPADGTSVPAGTPTALTAPATDDFDTNLARQVRWTSDRDGAIGSGAAFSTSRLSIGTHTITATASDRGNLVGQAPLTLVIRGPNVPPVVTIVKPADGGALLGGKPVLLSADATDAEDGDLSATIQWTSSLDGALGRGALLVIPSLSIGTHTLTAVVTDGDGATATTNVTVAVRPATLILSAVADTYV